MGQAAAGLTQWLSHVNEDEVFLSVVTFAELRFGVERLAPGTRRTWLDEWAAHRAARAF